MGVIIPKFNKSNSNSKKAIATSKTFRGKYYIKRTPLEKFADKVTKFSGSFKFLAFNIIWFVIWFAINLGLITDAKVFDPYPFGLLTLIVSLEAIILTVVVLISQNREVTINDLRSEIDASIDVISETKISKALHILTKIAEKNGIDLSDDKELKEMIQPIDKLLMESEFEEEVKEA